MHSNSYKELSKETMENLEEDSKRFIQLFCETPSIYMGHKAFVRFILTISGQLTMNVELGDKTHWQNGVAVVYDSRLPGNIIRILGQEASPNGTFAYGITYAI